MLRNKRITEMNIGDEFVVEYGCYGNYTKAVIVNLEDTENENVKMVHYTIPAYRGEEVLARRMYEIEIRVN